MVVARLSAELPRAVNPVGNGPVVSFGRQAAVAAGIVEGSNAAIVVVNQQDRLPGVFPQQEAAGICQFVDTLLKVGCVGIGLLQLHGQSFNRLLRLGRLVLRLSMPPLGVYATRLYSPLCVFILCDATYKRSFLSGAFHKSDNIKNTKNLLRVRQQPQSLHSQYWLAPLKSV